MSEVVSTFDDFFNAVEGFNDNEFPVDYYDTVSEEITELFETGSVTIGVGKRAFILTLNVTEVFRG